MKTEIVRKLWEFYEKRAWSEAEKLFAENALMTWHTSDERFRGGASIVAINRIYPEGWRIKILEIAELTDGRILSVIKVDHPPNVFFAASFFEIGDDKIQKIDEFWATKEKPPEWRNALNIEGYENYG